MNPQFPPVCSGDTSYELWLRRDLYTTKHMQWFYFRISNAQPNINYRFTIVNLIKVDIFYIACRV